MSKRRLINWKVILLLLLLYLYRQELYEIIAYHSGQSIEKVMEDSDRDFWMTATEAKEYGLVDEVLIMNPKKVKES